MADDQTTMRIGDGSGWAFFNGAWEDGDDGQLRVPDELQRQDGEQQYSERDDERQLRPHVAPEQVPILPGLNRDGWLFECGG